MNNDDILKKMDQKLDKLVDEMSDVKITQARHEENLKQHMRRSAAAEEGIQILKDELKPIKAHVVVMQTIGTFLISLLKVTTTVITIGGGIIAILKAMGKL